MFHGKKKETKIARVCVLWACGDGGMWSTSLGQNKNNGDEWMTMDLKMHLDALNRHRQQTTTTIFICTLCIAWIGKRKKKERQKNGWRNQTRKRLAERLIVRMYTYRIFWNCLILRIPLSFGVEYYDLFVCSNLKLKSGDFFTNVWGRENADDDSTNGWKEWDEWWKNGWITKWFFL